MRDRIAQLLVELKDRMEGVRFVRAESLHVTLRFFGSTPASTAEELASGLGPLFVSTPAMDVPVRGLGFFPSKSRPRVVWLGVELPDAALALQARCEAVAVAAGFPAETRPFRPHLTLGRFAGRGAGSPVEAPNVDLGTMRLDRAVYYRSDLRPGGAVHTPLASWTLG